MHNSPAITDAGSGAVRRFSQNQKHYLIAERFVQQAVEAGFLFLQHKSGTLLDADLMTKTLPAATLDRHTWTLENGYHVPARVEG